MRTATLLLAVALPLAAQEAGSKQDAATNALLARVRTHMLATLARQPNYTCLETIERSSRGVREKDFRIDDVVKLEVALVNGSEMFAWPGSKQFDDTDMRNFTPTGMVGSGEFGLYANTVFGKPSTEFEFRGQETLGHGTQGQVITMRYSFRVPTQEGMQIRVLNKVAMTGYHGSFYVEAGTMDVLRMEVQADELPKSLDLKDVTDTMEYARVKIGSGDFLLPSVSEVVMTDLRGDASRNRIRFSACHEFTGESKLKFGDDDENPSISGQDTSVPKQEIRLPKNTVLAIQLIDEIDTDRAAVGDGVRAALTGDLKVRGQVLLPKGTVVSGRIVRLERSTDFTVLGLMFQEAESTNAHAALDLTFDSALGPDTLVRGVRWGIRSPVRPHEGLVPLRPGRLRLGRGLVSLWRT
jgi:hypothetical protein